jgi:hypothetical protein
MNYEIVQLTMPDEDTRKDANFNGVSYWVVDYPLAAQRVQKAIYGTTNIEIDDNRDSALDYVQYNNNSGGSSNSGDGNDPTVNDSTHEYNTNSEETTAGDGEETTRNPLIPDWWPGRDDGETTAPDSGENEVTTDSSAEQETDAGDNEGEDLIVPAA